jgi:heme exporter protein D
MSPPSSTPWAALPATAALTSIVTVAVAAAGWLIGAAAAPLWLTGAVTATAATAAVIAVLARTGPGVAAAYALACALAACGWLVFVDVASPRAWLAIAILATAAPVLGALYPAVLRHQAKLAQEAHRLAELERMKAAQRKWPGLLDRLGYPGISLRGEVTTRSGQTLRLGLPVSGKVRYGTLAEATERIEIAARLRRGAIRVERGGRADEVLLHVAERDVLAESIPLPGESSPLTINWPLPVGLHEDGTVCAVTLREVAALIVGLRGSGKSNLINVLIAQLARCQDAVIFMIDLKGGRTALPWLRPWLDGAAARPVIDWVATTRDEAERMLRAVLRGIDARAHSGAGGEKITPSPRLPAVILIIEEVAVIFGMNSGPRSSLEGTTNATLAGLGTQITQLGRSEAIDPVMVTQRGAITMIGSGDLKSQCALRIGLGVATEADARLLIPDDVHMAADLARLIHPGSGIVQARSGRPVPVKFYRLTHDRIAGIAANAAAHRPAVDPMLAAALGPDYAHRWSPERAGHLPPPVAEVPSAAPSYAQEAQVAQVAQTAQVPTMRAATDREFAEIIAGLGSSEEGSTLARKRLLELLDGTGVMGATPMRLLAMLEVEGLAPTRESLDRWLAEEESAGRVMRASYGRWKTR